MPKAAVNKQDKRKAKKAEAKDATEADEVSSGVDTGAGLADLAKSLVLGSIAGKYLPKMQPLVMEAIEEVKTGKKEPKKPKQEPKEDEVEGEETENKEETNGDGNGEAKNGSLEDVSPEGVFASLQQRLTWHNSLGLAVPYSADDAMTAWKKMLALELDGGPRAKRKGNPGLDRVLLNFARQLPQYMHLLLALMALRAFLFRSFFACLPWLILYQFASVWLPLDQLSLIPALPLDKVDVKFRVLATVGLNALVWFFFAFEAVWRVWWLEKFFWVGIIATHAYVVRPVE